MNRVTHGEMLMSNEFYAAQFAQGRITDADLEHALQHARQTLPVDRVEHAEELTPISLKVGLQSTLGTKSNPIFTVADTLDKQQNTSRATFVTEEISKWCAAYYDAGQASWLLP